jgi:hypothetical protein
MRALILVGSLSLFRRLVDIVVGSRTGGRGRGRGRGGGGELRIDPSKQIIDKRLGIYDQQKEDEHEYKMNEKKENEDLYPRTLRAYLNKRLEALQQSYRDPTKPERNSSKQLDQHQIYKK